MASLDDQFKVNPTGGQTTNRGTKLTPGQIKKARGDASLQDQFKTTSQRAKEKGIVSSNGSDVGRKFDGRLITNQSNLVQGKEEPAPQAGFNGKLLPANDITQAGQLDRESALDPAVKDLDESNEPVSDSGKIGIRSNPLNQYSSYTYNIKLGVMTPEMLNAFSQGDYSSLNQNILIASGGVPEEERLQYFDTEFYIDDLDIESVVGLNQSTGGANTTSLSFKIIEPGGVTLFNRLIVACEQLGIKNYIDCPYFLKVSFKGYDDITDSNAFKEQSVPFITPIKITEVQNQVTQKGSEYDIQAVAFYDSALFGNECSIQQNIDTRAETVGEFLEQLTAIYDNFYKKTMQNERINNPDVPTDDQSYHTIKFDVDPEILKSKLVFNEDIKNPERVHMGTEINQGGYPQLRDNVKAFEEKYVRLTFNKGTNIVKILNKVIQQSEYIKKQKISAEQVKAIESIKDLAEQRAKIIEVNEKLKNPLNWYRIRNKKIIKNFQIQEQKYARENTFVVKKYSVSNRSVESYPGWGEVKPVKQYDYIYTGKNDSILDFNIKFDALYYQTLVANPFKHLQASGETKKTGEVRKEYENSVKQGENVFGIQPQQTTATDSSVESGQAEDTANQQAQADRILSENLYSNAMADMISVNLTIIGDPDFLVGYNEEDFAGDQINLLNSADEINCFITYRTPDDFDPETGMLRPPTDDTYIDSAFSGVYKIISVRSNFKGGKFTQNLETVRLFNQPGLGTRPRQQKPESTAVAGLLGGSQASLSPSNTVFAGLAAGGPTTQPEQDAPTNNTPVTGTLGTSANVATSNGNSVGFGLAATTPTANPTAPATTSVAQGQTSLTNAQLSKIRLGQA